MRYFVCLDNDNQPFRLFRLDIDREVKELHEAIWLDGEWKFRFGIMFPSHPDYREVPSDVAERLFPDAFAVSPQ